MRAHSVERIVVDVEPNKTIVRAFVEAINRRDWNRIDQLVSADFTRHSDAAGEPEIRSRAELKSFLRRELDAFPDAHESLEDLLADGNKVAARHRFEGTQRGRLGPYPATGNRMIGRYIAIYRVEEGCIAEAWAEWDTLSGLIQLGHFKPANNGIEPAR